MYRMMDPTPEDIKKTCAEIQSHWNERQRRKRETGNVKYKMYAMPLIRIMDLVEALREFGQNGRIFRE